MKEEEVEEEKKQEREKIEKKKRRKNAYPFNIFVISKYIMKQRGTEVKKKLLSTNIE